MDKIEIQAVGHFSCDQANKYDQPRQASMSVHVGSIKLNSGMGFEQALVGLQPGDWVWVLFLFHKNSSWKPMVRPPRGSRSKIGVFATRAPYRPNPIGMSVVQIKNIDGLNIEVAMHDLLDGSPIIDIKPYLDTADSYPGISPSWLDEEELHDIEWSAHALEKAQFLDEADVPIRSFLDFQLQFNPVDSRRKRVSKLGDKYEISYRTWRVLFEVVEPGKILILDLYSGYSESDLSEDKNPWQDKGLHKEFGLTFVH